MYELSVPWTGFKSVVFHLLMYLCVGDVVSKVRTTERCVNLLGSWFRGAGGSQGGRLAGQSSTGERRIHCWTGGLCQLGGNGPAFAFGGCSSEL